MVCWTEAYAALTLEVELPGSSLGEMGGDVVQ